MAFENWKLNRKVHKQEKKNAKKEELAQTTVRANDSMTNITNRTEKDNRVKAEGGVAMIYYCLLFEDFETLDLFGQQQGGHRLRQDKA